MGLSRSDKVKMEAVLVNCGQMILLLVLVWVGAVVAGSVVNGVVASEWVAVMVTPSHRRTGCRVSRALDRSTREKDLGLHPEERCSLTKRFRVL